MRSALQFEPSIVGLLSIPARQVNNKDIGIISERLKVKTVMKKSKKKKQKKQKKKKKERRRRKRRTKTTNKMNF